VTPHRGDAHPELQIAHLEAPRDYDQIPALVERGKRRVADFQDDLDALLATRPHVAGEAFSVADITARVAIDFADTALGLPVPALAAAIRRWHDALSARPSVEA
jgi:glutathione S-transferase